MIDIALADLFESVIKNKFDRIHISVPAKVVSYNELDNMATVKIASATSIEGISSLPEIQNVPVMFPMSKSSGFVFAVEKDDPVLLVFSDVDISHWIHSSAEGFARSQRRFNLNDCYAIVGALPKGKLPLGDGNSAKLFSGSSVVEFKKTGSVVINGNLEVLQ